MIKIKRRKRSKLDIAWDRTWTWMSLFVRFRDQSCITCGKYLPGREGEAGHFVHKSKTSGLYFDEFNVHKQCFRCNRPLSGNLRIYSKKIIEKYGIEKFDELNKKSYIPKKWTLPEILELEQIYKKKAEDLLNS